MRRRGMMKGKGKGYKNVIGRDPLVHRMSAKGIKQPQKINSMLKIKNIEKKLADPTKFESPEKAIEYYQYILDNNPNLRTDLKNYYEGVILGLKGSIELKEASKISRAVKKGKWFVVNYKGKSYAVNKFGVPFLGDEKDQKFEFDLSYEDRKNIIKSIENNTDYSLAYGFDKKGDAKFVKKELIK